MEPKEEYKQLNEILAEIGFDLFGEKLMARIRELMPRLPPGLFGGSGGNGGSATFNIGNAGNVSVVGGGGGVGNIVLHGGGSGGGGGSNQGMYGNAGASAGGSSIVFPVVNHTPVGTLTITNNTVVQSGNTILYG